MRTHTRLPLCSRPAANHDGPRRTHGHEGHNTAYAMSQRSTPAPSVSTLMDEANLTVLPKPFKIPNKTLSRRSKSKKQMIQLERDAALGVVVGKKGRKSVPKPPTSGNGARGLSVLDRPGKPRLVGAAAARANQRLARQARLAQQQTPADDEGDAETASNLDMDASVADADQLVTPTPEGAEREATPTSALALDDEMLDTEPERPKDLAQCELFPSRFDCIQ